MGVQSSIGIQASLVRSILALGLEFEDYIEVGLAAHVVDELLLTVR